MKPRLSSNLQNKDENKSGYGNNNEKSERSNSPNRGAGKSPKAINTSNLSFKDKKPSPLPKLAQTLPNKASASLSPVKTPSSPTRKGQGIAGLI